MALLHLPHHHCPTPSSSSSRCCICIGGTTAATTRPSSSFFFPKQGKRNSSIPVGRGQVACPLPAADRRRSHCHRLLRCSSSGTSPAPPSAVDAVELPLFPLPLVLFPGAVLPLQIFEFRYRILTHTLLQTDLRLGVVFSDSGSVAGVGCVGEVVKHERLVDDRFFLVCKGQERFRVSRIVRTKPYLVAEVVWLEDRPSSEGEEGPEALAVEVERYMRDVIRISNRLKGKEEKAAETEAEAVDLRRNLFPTPFSFFVGSTFEGAPREQQALLELEDTAARLKRERETLRSTLNYLTAAAAVKDAFPSSSSSSSPS